MILYQTFPHIMPPLSRCYGNGLRAVIEAEFASNLISEMSWRAL